MNRPYQGESHVALKSRRAQKPIIFGRKRLKKADEKPKDDTLDMLLHYAKAGMEYAEKSLEETPDNFSAQERESFLQNKNMLEQAPYLIENYKSKIDEYDALPAKYLVF